MREGLDGRATMFEADMKRPRSAGGPVYRRLSTIVYITCWLLALLLYHLAVVKPHGHRVCCHLLAGFATAC